MNDNDVLRIQNKLRDIKYTIALIEQILAKKQNEQVVLPRSTGRPKEDERLRDALVVHSD